MKKILFCGKALAAARKKDAPAQGFWNGIKARLAQGLAAQKPPGGKKRAVYGAKAEHRLAGVLRAGRDKPAASGQKRRNKAPVHGEKSKEEPLHSILIT